MAIAKNASRYADFAQEWSAQTRVCAYQNSWIKLDESLFPRYIHDVMSPD